MAEALILATADHSHTLTVNGYGARGNPILGYVVSNDESGERPLALARDPVAQRAVGREDAVIIAGLMG